MGSATLRLSTNYLPPYMRTYIPAYIQVETCELYAFQIDRPRCISHILDELR